MNTHFPRMFVATLLAVISIGAAGCGTDEPTDKVVNCTQDADCNSGFYCSEDDKCVQDCDPTAADPGCEAGESCSTEGRCVVDGECVVDGDCDSAPTTASCDGDTLVAYSQTGTCDVEGDETVCNYAEARTACENGCLDGECLTDPCAMTVCDAAPAPVCDADGVTLIDYTEPGTCSAGTCDYEEVRSSCAAGCLNGVCLAGACDNETCSNPPADTCDNDTVLRYADSGVCIDNNGAPFCDYDLQFEDCLYTGAECSNASCINPLTQVGPIVIVEYMANPAGSFNDLAEWFEIVNTSTAAVNLDGWVISSQGPGNTPETHTIAGFGEIGPGEVKVFGFSNTIPFALDYNYGGVTLANNSDFLQLETPDGQISDYVYYEAGSILTGRSRKLDPSVAADPSSNDDFANWCPSMEDEFSQSPSNYGTPGAANTACVADPCAGFTCEAPAGFCVEGENKAIQYMNNNVMCEVSRLNNPFCDFETVEVQCTDGTQLCAFGTCETIPTNLPAAGELIFTEFMGNPDGVDQNGEWFELHNTTAGDLALFSLVFEDSDTGGSHDSYQFLDPTITVAAGGYAVFARNVDPAVNGGVVGAVLYSGAHLKNDPDESQPFTLTLRHDDGTVVDTSFYDNPEDPTASLPSGQALQLDSGQLSAAGNDDAANWCLTASTSPGAANQACPQ